MSNNIYFTLEEYENNVDNYNVSYTGTIIVKFGIFRAEYLIVDDEPLECCGTLYWKHPNLRSRLTKIIFYKNNEVIFTNESSSMKSCLILYGDGVTEENTFYLYNQMGKIKIHNMKNEYIKNPTLGPDMIVSIKQINDKYAIAIYEEMCTCDRFTGLINLDILFTENKDSSKIRYYDNSRLYIPIYDKDPLLKYKPLYCNENGLIVKNLFTNKILDSPINFDDIFNELFDFYE